MRELKEAEFWLDSAKKLLFSEDADREKYTVTAAMTIHAIIRANDALTTKFLSRRAQKHDEAADLFLRLVQNNLIPSRFANLRKSILLPAINTKSKVDYKSIELSKADAQKWIRHAERFLSCAKECLK